MWAGCASGPQTASTEQMPGVERIDGATIELVKQEKYVDVQVKIEAGRITIWYETIKVKP